MSRQVIKCPDGTYALWSDGDVRGGEWVVWGMTSQDYIDYCVKKASEEARRDAERLLACVDEYGFSGIRPFACNFEQANLASVENGGPDLTTEEGRMSGEEISAGQG